MTAPRAGRPLGDVSRALLAAAARGPGTVRELAQRAHVGFDAARWKASALVRAGALQPLADARPQVLGLPAAPPLDALAELQRSFWERPDITDDADAD